MMAIFLIISLLLVQAILIFGMSFAYSQREFHAIAKEHYADDFMAAMFFAIFVTVLLPVLGLVMIYFLSRRAKHGLKFK